MTYNFILYNDVRREHTKLGAIDNSVKELNEKIKELRDSRNELSEKLVNYASENSLTHKIIQITDGNLKFQTRKQTSPLTLTFIERCLSIVFQMKNMLIKF